MSLPTIYRRSSEGAIATYDYVDVAEGTGIIIYYACVAETSTAEAFILTAQELYSTRIQEDTEQGNSIERNFDLAPFNLPQTVKGTGYVSCFLNNGAGAGATVQARILKWDGSSESVVSAAVISQSITNGVEEGILLPFTMTETHFKTGDVLRLEVIITAPAGGVETRVGVDPQNRDGTDLTPSSNEITTQFAFHCPFKLDI